MTILDRLTALGFRAEIASEKGGKLIVRIRTSKGWTYEKFASQTDVAAVDAWAAGHEPE